jgi:hypothetical protein
LVWKGADDEDEHEDEDEEEAEGRWSQMFLPPAGEDSKCNKCNKFIKGPVCKRFLSF